MPKKALLIEDERDIQTLLRISLEYKGKYQVLLANDGLTGIQIAQEEQPDVILLDVMMPKLDGFETAKRLKNNEKTKDIPIIFLTAKAQRKDIAHGLSLGATGYLTKPFPPQLDEEIDKLLQASSS